MASGYDGTIRIDSSIDPKGFNQGIKGLMAAVKPLALAVGAAFAFKAIVDFGRTAVDEAANMASALVGLQSIVDGTGNSFVEVHGFIDDFVKDGLVPAQNAITAYKNLLLRGYNTKQIETVLTALKNSAAFGRQASLTLGQAIQSASEGLKNENSILVDNAGVTKNVVLMWRDYAAIIGTTVGMLTKEQKIEAEVQGILQETRFQMGDAAKLADSYSGRIAALGTSMLNLKIAVGNAIIPIISAILPYIKAAIDALVVFFNRLALIMSILFGVDLAAQTAEAEAGLGGVADGADDAAASQKNLGEQTKKAGQAAKGALAAFDQLNVLQQESDTGSGSAGASPVAPIAPDLGLDVTPVTDDLDALREAVEKFKQAFIELFSPLWDALVKLGQNPIWTTIGNLLLWLWQNVLMPLGAWIIKDLLPILVHLIDGFLTFADDVLKIIGPSLLWLWENVLQPVFAFIGTVVIDALQRWRKQMEDLHLWVTANMEGLQGLFQVLALVGIIILLILSPIALLIAIIIALILVISNWGAIWAWITDQGDKAFKGLQKAWAGAWKWFEKTVIEPIKNGFAIAMAAIKKGWELAFTAVKTTVKGIINTIIGYINRMIDAILTAVNAILSSLSALSIKIPDWVPGFGGEVWRIDIKPIKVPKIPLLATGAVIPPNAAFAAILGDQRSGRNIEAPEALLRQLMREEMSGMAGEQNVRIEFGGSLGELVRLLKPYIDKETRRTGTSLIVSGVTS